MEKFVDVRDFDYSQIPVYDATSHTRKVNGKKRCYADIICSFDIETTNIREIKQAVMFVWQFALGPDMVVIGRTWDSYLEFLQGLCEHIPKNLWLCVYVHNLSFEFQFLRGIYHFFPQEVFAMENRSILRCDMFNRVEYRCSMKLSNDSLAQWADAYEVEHRKQSGEDFDYSKYRWPWTPLTENEYRYCIYDVLAVVECVKAVMQLEGDDLATIPATQTSFLRREMRKSISELGYYYFQNLKPSYELFMLLRDAFRGGDTHANRYYVGSTVEDVFTVDRSSSYPDVLCNLSFPVSKFIKTLICVDPVRLIKNGRALLFRFTAINIRLKHKYWGFPYIPLDKCECTRGEENGVQKSVIDNGRVIQAQKLSMVVTDVDFRIILDEYDFDDIEYSDVWFSSYGELPDAYTRVIKEKYRLKTELKGTDKRREYLHAKEMANACYGLTAQNPLKDETVFLDPANFNDVSEDDDVLGFRPLLSLTDRQMSRYMGTVDLKKKYQVAMREKDHSKRENVLYDETSPLLPYQWGVWCTAWARYELHQAMYYCMEGEICRLIYVDTDSLYYEGPQIDFTLYNNERVKRSMKSGANAIDAKGKCHYMGVLESDPPIDRFKTWGAKKYMYERDGEIKITIAGVSKKKGKDELIGDAREKNLDAFNLFERGYVFTTSAGVEAWYNDGTYGGYIDSETNKRVDITANVYLQESEYTLNTGRDYSAMLLQLEKNPNFCEEILDKWRSVIYNRLTGQPE